MIMRKATIYCAAALLATGAVATYATTPNAYSGEEAQQLSIAPYANLSDSKQVLVFLSNAESLVYRGDSTFAKMHINEALSAAAGLPSSPDPQDLREVHRVTILTMQDGTLERQMLIAQPENITSPLNFSPDALPLNTYKITKAEVHYVTADWNKNALLVALNNTLRDIEKGKAVSADFTPLHEQLLKGNEYGVDDRRAAQDNIALARALIRVRAYEPAKAAMQNANAHLAEVAKQKDGSPQRFKDIATMRNEMENVNATIEQNDPAAFKQLDQQLEKWWNLLS